MINDLALLLKGVASKLENGAEGVNRELLEESANKIEGLENVARLAGRMLSGVSKAKSNSGKMAQVPRFLVEELISALNEAGRYGPGGSRVEMRRR